MQANVQDFWTDVFFMMPPWVKIPAVLGLNTKAITPIYFFPSVGPNCNTRCRLRCRNFVKRVRTWDHYSSPSGTSGFTIFSPYFFSKRHIAQVFCKLGSFCETPGLIPWSKFIQSCSADSNAEICQEFALYHQKSSRKHWNRSQPGKKSLVKRKWQLKTSFLYNRRIYADKLTVTAHATENEQIVSPRVLCNYVLPEAWHSEIWSKPEGKEIQA